MQTLASKRRSGFGTNCFQCDNELIAPERSEYRDERQIRHLWHCSKCDCYFVVISPADTKSIKDIMTRIEAVVAERHRAAAACRESSSGGAAPRHSPYHVTPLVSLLTSMTSSARLPPRIADRVRHCGPR